MRSLYLLRHAKSSWDQPGLADLERPLARRGERDAKSLAERFSGGDLPLDVVLCSPAARAKQTVEPILAARRPEVTMRTEASIYGGSVDEMLAALRAVPRQA